MCEPSILNDIQYSYKCAQSSNSIDTKRVRENTDTKYLESNLSLLVLPPITTSTPTCALSCRDPRTQLRTLLGLCALSCRDFSYSVTQDLDLQLKSILLTLFILHFHPLLQFIASHYLYKPMVYRHYTMLFYIT